MAIGKVRNQLLTSSTAVFVTVRKGIYIRDRFRNRAAVSVSVSVSVSWCRGILPGVGVGVGVA